MGIESKWRRLNESNVVLQASAWLGLLGALASIIAGRMIPSYRPSAVGVAGGLFFFVVVPNVLAIRRKRRTGRARRYLGEPK
jgi:hypothetical protein